MGSIDILARHFAGRHPDAFLGLGEAGEGGAGAGAGAGEGLGGAGPGSAVEAVVRVVEATAAVEDSVSGCAFLCLATLCAHVQARMLPFLGRLLPPMLGVLETAAGDAGAWTEDRRLVVQSALASLAVASDVLPRFLSPYLTRCGTLGGCCIGGWCRGLCGTLSGPLRLSGGCVWGCVGTVCRAVAMCVEARVCSSVVARRVRILCVGHPVVHWCLPFPSLSPPPPRLHMTSPLPDS
jgi:hypothetical protein